MGKPKKQRKAKKAGKTKTKTKTEPKKSKKSKKSKRSKKSIGDGFTMNDLARLREEVDREQRARKNFQLEQSKMKALWENFCKDGELLKVQLCNRDLARGETDERHHFEISRFKHRLLHVQAEKHNSRSELVLDAAYSTSLVQKRHMHTELQMLRDMSVLKAEVREWTLQSGNWLQQHQMKQKVRMMELKNKYERRLRELEVRSHERIQAMVEAEDRRRRSEVRRMAVRMYTRVIMLMEDHSKNLKRSEDYYAKLVTKVMEHEMSLSEAVVAAEKPLERAEMDLSTAQRELRRLRDSLSKARQKLPELQKLQQFNQNVTEPKTRRIRQKRLEAELHELRMEHELLRQLLQKVERERDELRHKQMEVMMDLQQRSHLRQLQLGRKLALLTETMETKEAQLYAVLSTAGQISASKLEETLERKHNAIRSLQEQLSHRHREYERLVQTCTRRLGALGVPLHNVWNRAQRRVRLTLSPCRLGTETLHRPVMSKRITNKD